MVQSTQGNLFVTLRALRACFNDNGTLRLDPAKSQFASIDDAAQAVTILQAVDAALAQAAPPAALRTRGMFYTI